MMTEQIAVPGIVGGMQVVTELPEGYSGPDLRLMVYDQETVIVMHPERPPLMVDRETGAVACIVAAAYAGPLRWR